jgi:predicted transcriptional regulator
MKLKMDLTENGLLMFFKDYQLKALEALWSSEKGLSSKEVWEAVGSNQISRASIINFLEDSYENGLLDKREITGKGGHRGIYSPRFDEAGTKEYLEKVFKERLEALT